MIIEVVILFLQQKKKCENFIKNWNRIFLNMMQKKCRGVLMIKCWWHTRHLLFVSTSFRHLFARLCQEKSLTQSRWAFFNEIHPIGWVKSPQTAVKLSFGQWNSPYGEWVDFISPRTKWVISPERSEDFTFCEAKYFTFLFGAIPWHYFRTVHHQKSIKALKNSTH